MSDKVKHTTRSIDTSAPSSLLEGYIAFNTKESGGGALYLGLANGTVRRLAGNTISKEIPGTTYTLTNADNGVFLYTTSGSPVTIVYDTATVTIENFSCSLMQVGAGQATMAGTATIHNSQSHTKTSGTDAVVSIYSYAPNHYVFQGDTA